MQLSLLSRRAACLAAVLLAAAAGTVGAGPAPTAGIIEYEVQFKSAGQPERKSVETIWFKGERYRVETTTPRGKMVRIGGPDGTFLLSSGRNEAMKLPAPGQAPPPTRIRRTGIPGVPFGDVSGIPRFMKKVGSEKVGRYQAEIYEPYSYRIWVSPDVPIPVKTTNSGQNYDSVRTLKSARFNVVVPDNLFQLPKGTKIREMPRTPPRGGAPGAPLRTPSPR